MFFIVVGSNPRIENSFLYDSELESQRIFHVEKDVELASGLRLSLGSKL